MSKLRPIDIFATVMIIFVFSFFDYYVLSVLAQGLFIMVSLFEALFKRKQIPASYVAWWFIFSFWCLLSGTWALNTSTLLSCFISVIQVAMLAISIVLYVDCEKRIKHFTNSMILSACLLCFRFVTAVPISIWGNEERLKGIITFSSNNAPMMLCFVSLCVFNMSLKRKNVKLYIIIAIFIFVALLYGTRKVIIIIVIGISMQLLLSAKRPAKLVKYFILCCIVSVLGYYLLVNVQLLYGAIGYRIEGMVKAITGGSGDGSSIARLAFIDYAKVVFKRYPILGIGLDGFRYVNVYEPTYAHNNYYELLCDLGIVGFLLYYSFHCKMIYITFKNRHKDERLNLVLSVIICYLVIDYFNVSYSDELAHTMLAFMFAMYRVCVYPHMNKVSGASS